MWLRIKRRIFHTFNSFGFIIMAFLPFVLLNCINKLRVFLFADENVLLCNESNNASIIAICCAIICAFIPIFIDQIARKYELEKFLLNKRNRLLFNITMVAYAVFLIMPFGFIYSRIEITLNNVTIYSALNRPKAIYNLSEIDNVRFYLHIPGVKERAFSDDSIIYIIEFANENSYKIEVEIENKEDLKKLVEFDKAVKILKVERNNDIDRERYPNIYEMMEEDT